MDSSFSIDTIGEISFHEASPVTISSPRSAFEQQLCSQLLSLSGVAEILADRVMVLEARLAEVEGQQLADAADVAINDDADELLSASEEKVRMLRDRLAPPELAEPQPQPQAEATAEVAATAVRHRGPVDACFDGGCCGGPCSMSCLLVLRDLLMDLW